MAKINQNISLAPPAPLATDLGTQAFQDKTFALIQFWGTNADELNTFASETNSVRDEVNNLKLSAESAKNSSINAKIEAESAMADVNTKVLEAKSHADRAEAMVSDLNLKINGVV